MKLAICIPIYNFDVRALVQALHKQAEALSAQDIEIITIDDASVPSFKAINKVIEAWSTYIELPHNIGRAKIRNLFLEHSQADYFLFLDGDALVVQDNFLDKYLQIITQQQPPIICGGRVYPTHLASPDQSLRWRYGHAKESQTAEIRNQAPNRSFMTNNFVVKRAILTHIRFDERLSQYGHEDTLFGFELQKEGITIMHINNPILNGDIETNAVFMQKTEAGIDNLAQIIRWQQEDNHLINNIRLSSTYFALPSWIASVWRLIFSTLVRRPLRWLLLHKRPPLFCFDVYKLGCFAVAWQNKKK